MGSAMMLPTLMRGFSEAYGSWEDDLQAAAHGPQLGGP